MCGRFALVAPSTDLISQFAVDFQVPDAADYAPSWNVAPTLDIRVILERLDRETGELSRQMRLAHWGLVPHWARDRRIGARMINARTETLDSKPSFRGPLARQRCIIPVSGWYEWQVIADGAKQPWYFFSPDAAVLAFAGLYELWADPDTPPGNPGRWLLSTTIITRDSRADLARIHPREPVALAPEAIDGWLNPARRDVELALRTLTTPSPVIQAHRVGTEVNRVANNGPELIVPLENHPAE